MVAWGAAPSPLPPKSSLQSSKSLEHWRTEIVPERCLGVPYGCQEQLLFWCLLQSLGVENDHMDARNNISFRVSIRKCHLTHQDFLSSIFGVGSLEDRKGSRQASTF